MGHKSFIKEQAQVTLAQGEGGSRHSLASADDALMPLLSVLTDHDDLCFWRMSLRSLQLHFPENAKNFFGLSIDALPQTLDEWIERFVLEGDREAVRERTSLTEAHTSYVSRFTFRMHGPESRLRWIEQRGALHGDGPNAEMIWLSQDVTDKLQTTNALYASQSTLQDILARAEVGMVTLDSNGHFTFCNPAFCRMFGYEAEELLGKSLSALAVLDKGTLNQHQIESLLKQKASVFRKECQLLAKSGAPLWVEKNIWLLPKVADGDPEFFVMVTSIEERRQMTELLQQEHEKLQAVFEHADVGLALANSCGKITAMNRAALDICGLEDWKEAQAALAEPDAFFLLKYPDGRNVPRDQWPGIRTNRGDYTSGTHLMLTHRKTGRTRYIRYTGIPVQSASGEPVLTVYSLNDLTETRQLHEALSQSQRLEALGRLAGGVAHDFNNVLAVITGNLELIADAVKGEPAHSRIVAALDAAETGASINRRLLTIARKRLPKREKVDIAQRVSAMRELLERVISSGIKLHFELPDEAVVSELDPGEFDSAFLNLITNGRDAMPNGGDLFVSVGRDNGTKISGPDSSIANIHLAVRDTGTGMTPETLRLAAEPFFTTKHQGSGVGLGLTGVYAFANEYGGRVEIKSQVNRGTEVRIYLPDAGTGPDADDGAVSALPMGAGELVLVVEDNDAVREVTCQRMLKLGYRVEEAKSGDEAWGRILQGLRPDCLCSDIGMPGEINGIELAEHLQTALPHIPIVLCTGYHDNDILDGKEGIYVTLFKPCSLRQLAHGIHDALSSSKSPMKT